MTRFSTSSRVFIALALSCLLINGCGQESIKTPFNEEGYRLLKNPFYEDSVGNLYEKKYMALDNINSKQRHFYDSTLFYPHYPEQVALKHFIDIESFEQFEDFTFSRDKKHVYFARVTSSGAFRFIVEGANPATFSPIKYYWGMDDQHVYFETEIVPGADLATFKVSATNTDSAYDAKAYYYRGENRSISNE